MSFAIPAVGQDLKVFRAFDLSGGLDVNSSKAKLAMQRGRQKVTSSLNVRYASDGSLSGRIGFQLTNVSTTLNSKKIRGGFQFIKSDGTSKTIVATNANLYTLDRSGTTTVTSIKSGLSSSATRYSFAVYNDTLFIANGVDVPMQYDGTSVTNLGGSSPNTLRKVVAHGNRLFGLATAVPSRLYWSKLNNPTDWSGTTDAGFMDVNPNDNAAITDLVASNQELVILKENRPYRLQGIGPTTGYTVVDNLVPAAGSVGCAWLGAACFAGNDVYYASRSGVHRLSNTLRFGDLESTYISKAIEPYFSNEGETFYRPDIVTIGVPQLVYDPRTECLYLSMTSAAFSDQTDTILVYDLITEAWAVWRPLYEFTHMWAARETESATSKPTLMLGQVDPTDTNAFVTQWDTDLFSSDQNTAGIVVASTGSFRLITDMGEPGILKSPRHVLLYADGSLAGVSVNVYYDGATSPTITTTALATSNSKVARINLSGVCTYMEIEPATYALQGYEVFYRARRSVL